MQGKRGWVVPNSPPCCQFLRWIVPAVAYKKTFRSFKHVSHNCQEADDRKFPLRHHPYTFAHVSSVNKPGMAEVELVTNLEPEIEAKIDQLLRENAAADACLPDDPTELTPGTEQFPNQIPSEALLGPGTAVETISNAPTLFPAPFSYWGTYFDQSGTHPQQLTADKSGALNISITTYSSSQGAAYADVGSGGQFRNGFPVTLSANANLSYQYGCVDSDGGSNTYAYIGFWVVEYGPGGVPFRTVVDQKIQLWSLHTNHSFSGSEVYTFNSQFTPSVGLSYTVYVRAGAVVSSHDGGGAAAWARFTVQVPAILY